MPKTFDAVETGQAEPVGIGNIGAASRPIERMSEKDIANLPSEQFMNEVLTIHVHPDGMEGAYDYAPVSVNGVGCPIPRGRAAKVKRKYVEVLARCRTTNYEQRTQNPALPENIQMIPRTNLSYPFSVMHDPNPRGREWLQAILSEK